MENKVLEVKYLSFTHDSLAEMWGFLLPEYSIIIDFFPLTG